MAFNAVFSKKDFLEWVAEQIPDDNVIMITTHFNEVAYVKRTDSKNINFQFPAFGFVRRDTVKDAYGALKFSTLILERQHFQQGILDVVDGITQEYRAPEPEIKFKPKNKRSAKVVAIKLVGGQ
jgi:hypothetical protein